MYSLIESFYVMHLIAYRAVLSFIFWNNEFELKRGRCMSAKEGRDKLMQLLGK